jgi:hypothetical protein
VATPAERKRLQRERARRGHVTVEMLDREIARQFKALLLRKPTKRNEMAPYFRLACSIAAAFPKDRDRALQYLLPDMGAAECNPSVPRKHQTVTRHKRATKQPKRK